MFQGCDPFLSVKAANPQRVSGLQSHGFAAARNEGIATLKNLSNMSKGCNPRLAAL